MRKSKKQYLQADLNELALAIHQNAKDKGFYEEPPTLGKRFMMIVSELSEALEADRKGLRSDQDKAAELYSVVHTVIEPKDYFDRYNASVKGTFEEELADAVIRTLDFCAYKEIRVSAKRLEDGSCDFEKDDVGSCLLNITGSVFYASVSADCYYDSQWSGQQDDIDTLLYELHEIVLKCFNLADMMNIDLIRHIILKMKYNTTREHKHGKAY